MNCKKVKKWIPLYISDDLSTQELVAMEGHLNGCLSCYREYQAYLKPMRSLKRLGEKPDLSQVLDGFADDVMARIEGDQGGAAAPVPRMVYTFRSKMMAAAAMVMVLITAAFIYFSQEDGPVRNLPAINGTTIGNGPRHTKSINPMNNIESHPMLFQAVLDEYRRKNKAQDDHPFLKTLPHQPPAIQPVDLRRDF